MRGLPLHCVLTTLLSYGAHTEKRAHDARSFVVAKQESERHSLLSRSRKLAYRASALY